ncbi:hypothetical protein J4437_02730 [Candidatus Woesearchaeota archaeon]|nr:hypothetical protein [Candidatus Woesearchaeota archaeon]
MMLGLILTTLIVFSIIAVALGFYCKKYSIEENAGYISLRAYGLLLLVAGYILHTFGDYFSVGYGATMELTLESIAHVIILVSFIFFIISAKKILAKARGYWF